MPAPLANRMPLLALLAVVPVSVTVPPLASIMLFKVMPKLLAASLVEVVVPLAVIVTLSVPVDVVSPLALPMRLLTVMPSSAKRLKLALLVPDFTMAALTKMLPSPVTAVPVPLPAVFE